MKKRTDGNEFYLGIDLGTTNTQMALPDKTGIVKVLPNMDGDIVTLSIVSVAGNKPIVGKIARQDKFLNPHMVAEHFKKSMGQMTETDDPIVILISPDGTEYTPVILSAEVLRYMKESAEKIEGIEFKAAVVSVPAYFGYQARHLTKNAGFIAGFDEIHIVDEPTAAATYYGLVKPKKQIIAVFDFGGGTFDISILQIQENGDVEPIAVDGDPECGGGNIDEAIFQPVRSFVKKKGGELSPEKDLAEWLEVLDACKQAKESLARKDSAIIPLRIGTERTSMEVTYEQLTEYSAGVIATLRNCCQRALNKAGLTPDQIDSVLTVGGSSRLRFIPVVVMDIFGKAPVTDTDPDLAVAKGNAIIAAAHFAESGQEILVEGRKYLASSIKDRQIAARDLCIAAITEENENDRQEYNVVIIPSGSKLPFENIKLFTPVKASTSAVDVKIIDGKPGELSKNYTPLQQFEVRVQPTDNSNNPDRIEVRTTMDTEALVNIKVRDKLLNMPVPVKFKFHAGLSDQDISHMRNQLKKRHE